MDEPPVVEEKTRDKSKEVWQPRSLPDLLEHFEVFELSHNKVESLPASEANVSSQEAIGKSCKRIWPFVATMISAVLGILGILVCCLINLLRYQS
jgi:hypothetical protein